MLPIVVQTSKLRENLSDYLKKASQNVILINSATSPTVMISEEKYNMMTALLETYNKEDPEGAYKEAFVKKMIKRAKSYEVDHSISSLKDLL